MNESGLSTFMPLTLQKRGVQRVVRTPSGAHNVTLVDGMARAFYWQHLIDTGQVHSGSDIARAEGVHHSVVNELLRLNLLAPDIVEQLMEGRQPRRLTLMWFQRHSLPVDWAAQRALVASFEGAP